MTSLKAEYHAAQHVMEVALGGMPLRTYGSLVFHCIEPSPQLTLGVCIELLHALAWLLLTKTFAS